MNRLLTMSSHSGSNSPSRTTADSSEPTQSTRSLTTAIMDHMHWRNRICTSENSLQVKPLYWTTRRQMQKFIDKRNEMLQKNELNFKRNKHRHS
ncbi:hypothetical protein PHET_04833 [Paragonimus heterotremus]|uniref:Uncharacterized protein n=1 Tax=Paragonimus heterotremus TaxID=100268 RepID=A0A8J4SQ79_9TREM|nr:hypothetical protein PHET_04833 [Paragonimus heterotremus]